METCSNARRCNRLQGHLSTPLNAGARGSLQKKLPATAAATVAASAARTIAAPMTVAIVRRRRAPLQS